MSFNFDSVETATLEVNARDCVLAADAIWERHKDVLVTGKLQVWVNRLPAGAHWVGSFVPLVPDGTPIEVSCYLEGNLQGLTYRIRVYRAAAMGSGWRVVQRN